MTEYSPVLIGLTIFIVFANLYFVKHTGGIRNNILNIFLLATFSFYLLLTPAVYYFTENSYAVNVDVRDYWGIGTLQIFLHILFYSIGYYYVLNRYPAKVIFTSREVRVSFFRKYEHILFFIFIALFALIFINTLSVGINFVDIVLGKHGDPTLGLRGGSYYIQNLADSLITILIASFYFRIKKIYIIIMLLVAIPLFLILGFRYRILLTFFGFFMIYIFDNRLSIKAISKYLILLLIFFYALMLLTANRTNIYMQKFDEISFDYTEFPYDAVFDQAKGSLIDFAMYKSVDAGHVSIDYGETMFGYIFIKMLPSAFFSGGIKPYPPPQMIAIDNAISADRNVGEATTSLGGTFYAFYYPGIYIFAFVLGAIIARAQNRFEKGFFSLLVGLVFSLAAFQWITRGYFPQTIDHLVYMLFPILLLSFFIKIKFKF
jgi:hypothetical protein